MFGGMKLNNVELCVVSEALVIARAAYAARLENPESDVVWQHFSEQIDAVDKLYEKIYVNRGIAS